MLKGLRDVMELFFYEPLLQRVAPCAPWACPRGVVFESFRFGWTDLTGASHESSRVQRDDRILCLEELSAIQPIHYASRQMPERGNRIATRYCCMAGRLGTAAGASRLSAENGRRFDRSGRRQVVDSCLRTSTDRGVVIDPRSAIGRTTVAQPLQAR